MTDSQRRPVVIVDAFGRGSVLAQAFSERVPCLHVTSRDGIPPMFLATLRRNLFAAHLDAAALGRDRLIEALRERNPVAVVAGNELGVELADDLAEALGLPGNGSARSAARRNKFEMAAALAEAGLAVPEQACFADEGEAVRWFRTRPAAVVVKPLDSAGSDDVHICRTPHEVSAACRRILGTINLMLSRNDRVLVQDFMEGDEYIVNCVSQGGRHLVTDIWACTKRLVASGRHKIYDRQDLVDGWQAGLGPLCDYVRATLDALGIAHGPTHSEVMVTAGGPRLIEVGARITGQIMPHPFAAAAAIDQIGATVLCALSPGAAEMAASPYRRQTHACIVESIVPRRGRLNHAGLRRAAERLPSFSHLRFRADDGAVLEPTIDLSSAPSSIFLLHADPGQIEADYHALRRWERDGDDFVIAEN